MTKVIVSSKGACFNAPYLENAKYDMVTLFVIDVIRVSTCLTFSWVHLSVSRALGINDLIYHCDITLCFPPVGSKILLYFFSFS